MAQYIFTKPFKTIVTVAGVVGIRTINYNVGDTVVGNMSMGDAASVVRVTLKDSVPNPDGSPTQNYVDIPYQYLRDATSKDFMKPLPPVQAVPEGTKQYTFLQDFKATTNNFRYKNDGKMYTQQGFVSASFKKGDIINGKLVNGIGINFIEKDSGNGIISFPENVLQEVGNSNGNSKAAPEKTTIFTTKNIVIGLVAVVVIFGLLKITKVL